MTPLLRSLSDSNTVDVYYSLSAGLVMGFMLLATGQLDEEDALSAVPRSLREAARLGRPVLKPHSCGVLRRPCLDYRGFIWVYRAPW